MKIKKISINRFRVFKTKSTIYFNEKPTVLIGPNNGGKSSICNAVAMMLYNPLYRTRFQRIIRRPLSIGRDDRNIYQHERDYPISLKEKPGRRWPTEFSLEIELSEKDLQTLAKKNCKQKNSTFVIRKKYDFKKEMFNISITDPRRLSAETGDSLIQYIFQKIRLVVVPAIREKGKVVSVFEEIFKDAVGERINTSRNIKSFEKKIKKLLSPVIKETKKSLANNLNEFFSSNISFDFKWDISLVRSIIFENVLMSDGVKTSINLKGDGTQSLLYLALLTELVNIKARQASKDSGFHDVFIIEEPEAHLNSSFQHHLKEKLCKLKEKSTVIITTHSPCFVDFFDFTSNYLITDSTIKNPKDKQEIAKVLGVRIEENLTSNMIAILTEGKWDKSCIEFIAEKNNKKEIFKYIDIVPVLGAGNLTSTFQRLKSLYKYIIIMMDNDKGSKKELKKLKENGVDESSVFLLPVLDGRSESEIEDILTLECQKHVFSKAFNRDIPIDLLRENREKYKKKWSNWIIKALSQAGVPHKNPEIIKGIIWEKTQILELNKEYSDFFHLFLSTLEKKVCLENN